MLGERQASFNCRIELLHKISAIGRSVRDDLHFGSDLRLQSLAFAVLNYE